MFHRFARYAAGFLLAPDGDDIGQRLGIMRLCEIYDFFYPVERRRLFGIDQGDYFAVFLEEQQCDGAFREAIIGGKQ